MIGNSDTTCKIPFDIALHLLILAEYLTSVNCSDNKKCTDIICCQDVQYIQYAYLKNNFWIDTSLLTIRSRFNGRYMLDQIMTL